MSSENSVPILLFTDGSSRGNPGPGGYGVVLKYGKHEKELSEGFRNTTNNRMELLAVIKGLEALKKPGIPIIVYTDSKYVHDAVEKGWVFNWVKQNFKKKANPDLWRHFLKLYAIYKPRFQWVKGHAGHPENERCDQLATEAADTGPWLIDEGFEQSNESN
ncbi:MAG: ribonuclease HI [Flavobacteriales bacterium]|nr:ribonuclease HI [Flavobacteriales bacterium]